jgi:hypothetical protein
MASVTVFYQNRADFALEQRALVRAHVRALRPVYKPKEGGRGKASAQNCGESVADAFHWRGWPCD